MSVPGLLSVGAPGLRRPGRYQAATAARSRSMKGRRGSSSTKSIAGAPGRVVRACFSISATDRLALLATDAGTAGHHGEVAGAPWPWTGRRPGPSRRRWGWRGSGRGSSGRRAAPPRSGPIRSSPRRGGPSAARRARSRCGRRGGCATSAAGRRAGPARRGTARRRRARPSGGFRPDDPPRRRSRREESRPGCERPSRSWSAPCHGCPGADSGTPTYRWYVLTVCVRIRVRQTPRHVIPNTRIARRYGGFRKFRSPAWRPPLTLVTPT